MCSLALETRESLRRELRRFRGPALILGATDTGKSTLAGHLARSLLQDGFTVSLLDSDLGQSTLGPPGTVSVGTFACPEDLRNFSPEHMVFIGSLSPAGHMRPVIGALEYLMKLASGDFALIDTSGLIAGNEGRALKLGKIRALRPAHVVALQRSDELEHILVALGHVRLHRLRVSPKARRKTRAERTRYRENCCREYFRGAGLHVIPLRNVEVLRGQKPGDVKDMTFVKGCLVGLNRGRETLAVGAVAAAGRESLSVLSPPVSTDDVDRVIVSPLTVGLFS
jgi:polynucleotide 5'-hydroxyl-kinase GRC3/NOL9